MQGKVALVTGGTGGIGTAICAALAAEGATVVTTFHSNEDKAKAWQAARDFAVQLVQCDVSEFDSAQKAVAEVEANVGPVDILINNAGITRDTTLRKMTAEQWTAVIQTNLNSAFNMTRPLIEGMTSRGFGRIVNISSVNGQKGQLGQTNYSAAKAGVHGFTMALAQEVARKGVTVNTISPGYIATEMVMAVPEEIRQKIVAQIPVGRLGEPAEIARLVAFLCAPESGFMTGADFSINGGQHMY
ncbi:MAG: acetoacetyl-CoA reductase [Gammaproteobacteria bacterium]|nr:acetoacetyl-CoA reductase [Gammaproteobacteria bacterium]